MVPRLGRPLATVKPERPRGVPLCGASSVRHRGPPQMAPHGAPDAGQRSTAMGSGTTSAPGFLPSSAAARTLPQAFIALTCSGHRCAR